jgi:ATP-binding cassette subfamily B protein
MQFGGPARSADDPDPWETKVRPGTVRRVLTYFRPHKGKVALFVLVASLDSLAVIGIPLLLMDLVNDGILKNDLRLVVVMACLAAGLAVAIPAVLAYNILGRHISRIEAELEGFAYDLRELLASGSPQSRLATSAEAG